MLKPQVSLFFETNSALQAMTIREIGSVTGVGEHWTIAAVLACAAEMARHVPRLETETESDILKIGGGCRRFCNTCSLPHTQYISTEPKATDVQQIIRKYNAFFDYVAAERLGECYAWKPVLDVSGDSLPYYERSTLNSL